MTITTERKGDTTTLTLRTVQVRRQTWDDVLKETTLLDLPVVFTGTLAQANAYCKAQPGYVFKQAKRQLFGGYFYNRDESVCLLLT